jgi:tryptophan-rich sensory protein
LLSAKRNVFGLIGWLALVVVVAAIGAAASVHAGTFYSGLVRPDWAPPPSVFGPVWAVLYVLMGLAAWIVWRKSGFRSARGALALFMAQLALNASWSWLFFAWHRGALAFADVVLLWATVLGTAVAFWRTNRLAGAMLLPYLAWVSFAAALNFSVWQLNPRALGS